MGIRIKEEKMAFSVNGFDISVNRYDYGVDMTFTLTNPDGSSFDLSGYTVQFVIKAQKYQEESIYEFSGEFEGNVIRIPLVEEITANDAGPYYYAIRLIKNGVFVDTILQANFMIVCNTFQESGTIGE